MPAAASDDRQIRLRAEFDRQVGTLLRLGYPQLMGMSQNAFVRQVTPLADTIAALPKGGRERIPFLR